MYASLHNIPPGLGIELSERLKPVAGAAEEIPHGPGLTGAGVRRSRAQDILARARIGAGDDTPTAPIPLFDHGLVGTVVDIDEVSHGPDVGGGDAGDSSELPGAWAGNDAPTRAIPLLDQGLNAGARNELPHGPDVVARDRRCC